MKRRIFGVGLILAVYAVLGGSNLTVNSAQSDRERLLGFSIDVACDARTYTQNNVNQSSVDSHRGDTFIVEGKIFPGGTIPRGDGVFSPDNPGAIGTWICRGTWMINSEQLARGASPAFDTSQIYLLPDESKQLFSEGLEGLQPTLRAVTGGTGVMSGAVGQVRQELLGTNVTGLFNFRFTFRINQASDR